VTFWIIAFLFAVSFLMALNSLRSLSNKKEIEKVKRELKKGRVIFQKDYSSRASGSSD